MRDALLLAPIILGVAALGSVLTGAIRRSALGRIFRLGVGDPMGLNLLLCLALAVLAGWLLPKVFVELPRDLLPWLTVGGTAAASGSWGHNQFVHSKESECDSDF